MNHKLFIFSLFSLSLCLASCSLFGQKRPLEKSFHKAAMRFYGNSFQELATVPGVSIVVVKGDKTLFQEGFGYADMKNKIKADASSNFYIASSTKSFTGLLASLLDAEEIIKLDDPLTKYFPNTDFPEDLKAGEIKIRDLITHTTGLENDPLSFRVAFSGNHDFPSRLELMNDCRTNKAGKGTFSYTNTGYNIYAIIVEKVTGKSWKDHLQEKIFEPLGMNRTSAYISKAKQENWAMALPYMGRAEDDIREVYLKKKDNTMQAAGGLVTNGEDLANWLKVQIGLGQLKGKRIFPEAIMKSNRSAMVEGGTRNSLFKGKGYGMGWQVGTYAGEETIWHFGGFGGFLTHISYMPEKEIGVAVMVNEGFAGNRLKDLYAAFAYDYLLGKLDSEEAFEKKSKELKEGLQERLKRIKEHEEDRAKREWQLSLPFEKYTGSFSNNKYGEIKIEMKQQEVSLTFGNLYCVPTPYTEDETMRVGWIPGSGSVIGFQLENGEVKGLRYFGEFFEKKGAR